IFAWGGNSIDKVTINGEVTDIPTQQVSGNFYEGLGLVPLRGRLLTPDDDRLGAAPVVVISYRLWERQFARDPSAVGATVSLKGRFFTIVGITPDVAKEAVYARAPDITIPLIYGLGNEQERLANWWLVIVGRKEPKVTLEQVRANFAGAFDRAAKEE